MQRTSVEPYEAAGELFKVLASPARLAILDLLAAEPRYVNQLVELTGLTQPNVSQHLRVLRYAGVVHGIRRHRAIAYALRDELVARILRDALTRGVQPPPGRMSPLS